MKQNKIEKVLTLIAKVSSESTSCIAFYEPKIPAQLVKKEDVKEK